MEFFNSFNDYFHEYKDKHQRQQQCKHKSFNIGPCIKIIKTVQVNRGVIYEET